MFDNVAEYSGLFSTLGFESEEYFNTLIKGSQEGIYNLDYLNDVVKEFGIRIKDGSKSTTEAIAYLFADDGIDNFVESLKTAGSSSEAYQALMAKVGKETADMWTADLKKTGKASEDATTFIQMTMGSYDEFMQGMTDGSIKGSDAMQMIIEKIQSLDDPTTRAQMGVSLFGTKWEDLEETAMFSLTNIGGEIENLGGSMQSVTDGLEDTFGYRLNELTRSAVTSLEPVGLILLDFAEKILPKVIEFVEGLAKWFSNLSPVMQGVTVAIGAIAAAIGPFLVAAGMIISAIGQLTPLFVKLVPIIKGAGAAIAGISAPVAIAIAAVTALIAIGVALYKNWDQISGQLKKIWETIKTNASSAFKQMGDSISKAWDAIKSATSKVWDSIKSSLSSVWDAIKSTASNVFNSIKTSITSAFEATRTAITNVWNAVKSLTTDTWNVMKTSIQNAINLIKGIISAGMQLIKGDWQGAWDTLKSTLSNMIESMKSTLMNTNLFSIGKDIINGLIRGIKDMTGKAIEAVTGVVDGVINKAKNILGIKSPSRVFMEIGHDTNAGFIEGIKENNNKLQKTVGNVYGSLASSAQKSAEVSTSNIKSTTSTIDNSKYMQPQIHITVQGGNMSASEIARKALQTQRQLAMEWGV